MPKFTKTLATLNNNQLLAAMDDFKIHVPASYTVPSQGIGEDSYGGQSQPHARPRLHPVVHQVGKEHVPSIEPRAPVSYAILLAWHQPRLRWDSGSEEDSCASLPSAVPSYRGSPEANLRDLERETTAATWAWWGGLGQICGGSVELRPFVFHIVAFGPHASEAPGIQKCIPENAANQPVSTTPTINISFDGLADLLHPAPAPAASPPHHVNELHMLLPLNTQPREPMLISMFCVVYNLNDSILEKLTTNHYKNASTFRFICLVDLEKMEFLPGDIAELQDTLEVAHVHKNSLQHQAA
ncbi:hypothetical protein DFH08DRAFT_812004 [Mycena albidolilacea]|uniref:Uncharacterized protein n=1 Tax=Mycena albidolilacea TaxID=1033008 RepID=A0AAD7EPM7_9AGAR|nr:hypothetical protein DFH08DRAFT_812004 [Mycena albidolilacea]